MSKYKELKKNIFDHDWFMNTNYKSKIEILYKIAKLETENLFNNVRVIKFINYSYFSDSYTIAQLVNTKYNDNYIMIINLTKKGNRIYYNHVTLISKYDFE